MAEVRVSLHFYRSCFDTRQNKKIDRGTHDKRGDIGTPIPTHSHTTTHTHSPTHTCKPIHTHTLGPRITAHSLNSATQQQEHGSSTNVSSLSPRHTHECLFTFTAVALISDRTRGHTHAFPTTHTPTHTDSYTNNIRQTDTHTHTHTHAYPLTYPHTQAETQAVLATSVTWTPSLTPHMVM